MSIYIAIAQLMSVGLQELGEYQRLQHELAEGLISEADAWKRLRTTREQYAATARAWDEAGQSSS